MRFRKGNSIKKFVPTIRITLKFYHCARKLEKYKMSRDQHWVILYLNFLGLQSI